jgi:recombination protein RecA
MYNLDEAISSLNKKFGMGTAMLGSGLPKDPARLPSGIFALDFTLGGGLPVHQISSLLGPEHGGKTSSAMSFMGMAAKLCWRCFNIKNFCTCSEPALSMRSVWADVEGKFNASWAQALGASPADYVLVRADDGNQFGDILVDSLTADDCGLVVLDSIAALIPTEFTGSTLEDKFIGTQSLLVRNLILKVINRLTIEHKREHPCMVLLINQLRSKIGVMFGSTEQPAGGWFAKYAPSLVVRVAKRAMQDKEKYKDKERDVIMAQRHAFQINKFSVMKLGDEGEFVRAIEDINTDKVQAKRGAVLDHKVFIAQLEKYGFMTKEKAGFAFNGRVSSKAGFIEEWVKNPLSYYQDQINMINSVKESIINNA